MLGYDQIGAVSFTKGCYPGQEIVARTHYLGKVKRKPLLVTIMDQPVMESGSRVQIQYEAETVDGTLVDTAPEGTENTLMFIITRVEDEKKPVSISHESRKRRRLAVFRTTGCREQPISAQGWLERVLNTANRFRFMARPASTFYFFMVVRIQGNLSKS